MKKDSLAQRKHSTLSRQSNCEMRTAGGTPRALKKVRLLAGQMRGLLNAEC